MRRVVVIRTGNANLASVQAGLLRAGAQPVLSEAPSDVEDAVHLVLPGVGALGETKARLDQLGLSEPLARRVRSGRPTFAVCLGLQLLLEGSEESPGVPGLSVVEGRAERFSSDVRVPQLGWNYVEAPAGARYLESGEYYFANSYRLTELSGDGFLVARSEHGGAFVAAFERGGLLACQFHPELSGAIGARVIARWLERSVSASEAAC